MNRLVNMLTELYTYYVYEDCSSFTREEASAYGDTRITDFKLESY